MSRQTGFTLVEIAIVLVVIGLLLGGVLKGQELVLNARIRSAINEYNNVASASFAYQDRYRQIPGDDDTVVDGGAGRWSGVANMADGNSNGVIEGDNDYANNQAAAGTDETGYFWQHLRADGLIVGAETDQALPTNAFDGATGVQDTVFGATGIGGPVICQSNIPFKGATIIDQRLDDGVGTSGIVQSATDNGALNALPAGSDAYAANNRYVVCREL